MFVALYRDARLEAYSNHPEPRLNISVQQLEENTFLIGHKGQIFLRPM
jgi:hypothetical protein